MGVWCHGKHERSSWIVEDAGPCARFAQDQALEESVLSQSAVSDAEHQGDLDARW